MTNYINRCFFSSTVRGPRALEAFDKSMRLPPPLLGFGTGFAFSAASSLERVINYNITAL